jgi:hypothetical protein
MMNWSGNGGWSGWDWALMTIGMIVFCGVLIPAGMAVYRYLGRSRQP